MNKQETTGTEIPEGTTFSFVVVYYDAAGTEIRADVVARGAESKKEARASVESDVIATPGPIEAVDYYIYDEIMTSRDRDSVLISITTRAPMLNGRAARAWHLGAVKALRKDLVKWGEDERAKLIQMLNEHGISGDHIRAFEEAMSHAIFEVEIK